MSRENKSKRKVSEEKKKSSFDIDWNSFEFHGIFAGSRRNRLEEILKSGEKYRMLLEISKALNKVLKLDELLGLVLDMVLVITKMERGFLLLLEDDAQFRVRAARDLDHRSVDSSQVNVNRSIISEVARTQRPVYIADIEKSGSENSEDKRTVVCFPLKSSSELLGDLNRAAAVSDNRSAQHVVGLIYVEGPMTRPEFPSVDLEFLDGLASQATPAIENAKLYETLNADREQLAGENLDLRREVKRKYTYGNIIGKSDKMREIFDLVDRVSGSNVNVLLRGESGTGKELFAKTIHYNSTRAKKPFVSVNCAALPETLLESELFGIEKGVATGVLKRIGKFEYANGGTFFLDEIGDMSLPVQAKLLRVLENKEIERVGGKASIRIDVRIVSATNKDLEAAIQEGDFREDLYYRLNVVPIFLPPLRERTSDIPLLTAHFLEKHAGEQGKEANEISKEALDALMEYDWPGNARELENVIQRAVILTDSKEIEVDSLPAGIFEKRETIVSRAVDQRWTANMLVTEYARQMLKRNSGNLTKTARDLGLDFKTLKKRLDESGK
ncbi:sigma 54-interacting transcriptional regulator [Acidobacteriota bacterium]